jgi:hypothetical protein
VSVTSNFTGGIVRPTVPERRLQKLDGNLAIKSSIFVLETYTRYGLPWRERVNEWLDGRRRLPSLALVLPRELQLLV